MARDIDIGNSAITGANPPSDGELKRIRRLLEVIVGDEVSVEDAD